MLYLADLPLHVYLEESTLTDEASDRNLRPGTQPTGGFKSDEKTECLERLRQIAAPIHPTPVPGPRMA